MKLLTICAVVQLMLAGVVYGQPQPTSVSAELQTQLPPQTLPADSAYVRAQGEHLMLDGKQIRFWAAIGGFPGPAFTKDNDIYAGQRLTIQRLRQMGFNAVRLWHYGNPNYTKGDGSLRDRTDFFLAECQRQGVHIWTAGLGGGFILGTDIPGAAKLINEPATEQEWSQAMNELMSPNNPAINTGVMDLQYRLISVFDARAERFAIASMKKRVQHVNQHNGLRYSDDPTNAVWELTNEQWWMQKMINGQWQNLPGYFRKSLLSQWHAYLKNKYTTDDKLRASWQFLMPGESLEQQTILLAPSGSARKPSSFNDTNPAAIAAFEGVAQAVGRSDFTVARSNDVLAFFTTLLIDHKQRFASELKTWGKSCALSPLVWDTGIGESIQTQFMHQHADAVSHCAYMEGIYESLDPAERRYPFYTTLDKYPRISNDVPWLEHNRFPGKPFLNYETQLGNPAKYRAEFPMRLAALASIQDWSAVSFHFWAIDQYDFSKENPFVGHNAQPGSGAYQYHYTFDEIAASIRLASGEVFKNNHLATASNPTTFTFGRKSLYHPDSMDYGRSYGPEGLDNMLYTTYRHGMRLVIDPKQEEDSITGPVVRMKGFNVPTLIRPETKNGTEIEFDTHKAHLMFDAPGVAGYVGFFANYRADSIAFKNGVVLSDITFNHPKGANYPVSDDEKYLAFTLVSTSTLPLDKTASAMISLVSTSENTGLKLDPAKNNNQWGDLPVLVTRVGAKVTSPAIAGMTYTFRNFNMKPIGQGTIGTDGTLNIPADQPVFIVELSR
jgi:hypothetical protein